MQISLLNVIFGRCTAETLVTLDVSTRYTEYEETIICAKPLDTFLNRNSGIDCGIIKILIRIFEVSFSKYDRYVL